MYKETKGEKSGKEFGRLDIKGRCAKLGDELVANGNGYHTKASDCSCIPTRTYLVT